MAEQDCWLQNNNVRGQLVEYFSEIDKELSLYYEDHPQMREEHIESRLATLLETQSESKLQLPIGRLQRERLRIGLKPINLKIKVSHITSQESQHGADIGLIAELDVAGEYHLTKATLIQGKRLYPDKIGLFHEQSEYKEIFAKTGNPQWIRMLDITSSSVYFLYNPHEIRFGRRIRPIGTRVITAQQIAGKASAISTPRLTAADALKQGKHLSNWIIDDFICCHIGDTRPEVIKTAYGKNPKFPVKYTISLFITSENSNPVLFTY